MRIEEKIEKYLVTEAKHKYEIHPTDLEALLDSGYYNDVSGIEVVVRASEFLDGGEIGVSKKAANNLMKKIGAGAKVVAIKNDTLVATIDKSKLDTKRFSKFADNMDDYNGGLTNMDVQLFVYITDVSPKDVRNLGLNMDKVAASYRG